MPALPNRKRKPSNRKISDTQPITPIVQDTLDDRQRSTRTIDNDPVDPATTTREHYTIAQQDNIGRATQSTVNVVKNRQRTANYSDKDKRVAVAAAYTVGHPYGHEAHEAACKATGLSIPLKTLQLWLDDTRDDIKQGVLSAMPQTLTPAEQYALGRDYTIARWKQVEDTALDQLVDTDKAGKAHYKDLAIAGGIARTHLNKLTSLPPEIETINQRILALCGTTEHALAWLEQLSQYIAQQMNIKLDVQLPALSIDDKPKE